MLEKRLSIVLYSYSVLFFKKKLEMEKNVHSKKERMNRRILESIQDSSGTKGLILRLFGN